MNKNIIFAIIKYYLYYWRHSLDRIGDSFYWPAMNLFLWGLTSVYIKNTTNNLPNIVFIIVTGVIFWLVIWRAQHEISVNFLEEFWNRNLVNLFSSPLRLREWIVATMVLSIFKMLITLAFAAILALIFFSFNIFYYGFLLIPFTASLLMTGWILGFIVIGIVVRVGPTFQTLAWTLPMLISPFSAVYYSVDTLPHWAQVVSKFIPSTYVLEGMREVIFTGRLSYDKLVVSFALNIIYLISSILFFSFMFEKSKKLGLGRFL